MPRTFFLFDRPESVATWSAIDDRVMGGVSRSTLRFDPAGHAVFAGTVSADNHGGFASVRSAVAQPEAGDFETEGGEAGGFDAIELDVRGDGRRYKLNLRTDRSFDGVNYQAAGAPGTRCRRSYRRPPGPGCACRLPISSPPGGDVRSPTRHRCARRASNRWG